MNVNKMTDEQRKLVEDNHNLIYGYLNKNELDIDEYYDIAAIGLCNAGMKYNLSKGKFSTFAYKCMDNKVKQNKYLANMKCRKSSNGIISYDIKLFEDKNESYIDYLLTSNNIDISNEIITGIDYSNFLNKLNAKEKTIINYLKNGYNQTEIGKMMGITQQTVSNYVKKIKTKWLNFNK